MALLQQPVSNIHTVYCLHSIPLDLPFFRKGVLYYLRYCQICPDIKHRHHTPQAVLLSLKGSDPEMIDCSTVPSRYDAILNNKSFHLSGKCPIHFDMDQDMIWWWDQVLKIHPNGMRFSCFDRNGDLATNEYFRCGLSWVSLYLTSAAMQHWWWVYRKRQDKRFASICCTKCPYAHPCTGDENLFYKGINRHVVHGARLHQTHQAEQGDPTLGTPSKDDPGYPLYPFNSGNSLQALTWKHNIGFNIGNLVACWCLMAFRSWLLLRSSMIMNATLGSWNKMSTTKSVLTVPGDFKCLINSFAALVHLDHHGSLHSHQSADHTDDVPRETRSAPPHSHVVQASHLRVRTFDGETFVLYWRLFKCTDFIPVLACRPPSPTCAPSPIARLAVHGHTPSMVGSLHNVGGVIFPKPKDPPDPSLVMTVTTRDSCCPKTHAKPIQAHVSGHEQVQSPQQNPSERASNTSTHATCPAIAVDFDQTQWAITTNAIDPKSGLYHLGYFWHLPHTSFLCFISMVLDLSFNTMPNVCYSDFSTFWKIT